MCVRWDRRRLVSVATALRTKARTAVVAGWAVLEGQQHPLVAGITCLDEKIAKCQRLPPVSFAAPDRAQSGLKSLDRTFEIRPGCHSVVAVFEVSPNHVVLCTKVTIYSKSRQLEPLAGDTLCEEKVIHLQRHRRLQRRH